jgi:protein ImuB
MKTYAVLLVPEFRLQATLRHQPELIGQPVALLDIKGTKSLVVEMNAGAEVFHVSRGMTPTQALARCAELRFVHANPGHERSAQEALLQIAEGLSPFVESTAPGVATVELPAKPEITAQCLRDRAILPLAMLKLESGAGVASTPALALMAAQFAQPVKIVFHAASFLGPLPVSALQPTDEIASVLASWGIHTIGQFIALPEAQVWERLGPDAVRLWEDATGGRSRPLKLIKPQEFFAEEADLEHPVEMLEPLLFLLRRFLEQIAARLGHAYLVAGRLRLVLRFERNDPYRRTFTLPQPTRDVTLLFRMLHTHLENFTSESAIIGVELAAKPVRPQAEQFSLLEPGLRDPHQFAETLARLQALLGPDAVGTPEIEASHHPDAFHLRPYDLASAAPTVETGLLIGVPWLRFTPTISADVVLNGESPAYLYSARESGPIREARGPWRMEGDWWDVRPWAREEWDIATDEGMYRLVRAEGQWFLDGIYA